MDLSFMLDKQQLILMKNTVIDELDSWNGILSVEDERQYHKLIQQLTILINNLE